MSAVFRNPESNQSQSSILKEFDDWNRVRRGSRRLSELLDRLDTWDGAAPLSMLTQLFTDLHVKADELSPHLQFDTERYRRNPIRQRAHYEAWLLCWLPEQISPIHDHAQSSCGVAVLAGSGMEFSFVRNDAETLRMASAQRLTAGSITGSLGGDIHQVANWSRSRPLVSLHIYSPPLRNNRTYPESSVVRVPAARVSGIDTRSAMSRNAPQRDCA